MIVYLAGPMLGRPEFNTPAFDRAARALKAVGHDVYNPAAADRAHGFDWTGASGTRAELEAAGFDRGRALANGLQFITTHADCVAVLPGWASSTGARAEVATARAVDIPVYQVASLIDGTEPTPAATPLVRTVRLLMGVDPDTGDPLDVDDPAKTIPGPSDPPAGETILEEAQRLTRGDRNEDYGPPDEDFARAGRMWAALLGIPEVTAEEVALCMVALKMSRQVYRHKRDNLVDIAGYAACVEMIHDRKER